MARMRTGSAERGLAVAVQEQPLVSPQLGQRKQEPLRIMIEPHSAQGGASSWF